MKALFFIPAYKRLRVTELCFRSLRRFLDNYKGEIEFDVLIIESGGGNKEMAAKYGFGSMFVNSSYPLGKKKNIGLYFALEYIDFDYLLELDSDTLINSGFVKYYEPRWNKKTSLFGINRIGFLQLQTGRMLDYTVQGELWITGRSLSRELIETTIERNKSLWTDEKRKCLGWDQHCRIYDAMGRDFKYTELDTNNELLFLDMKDEENVTGFEELVNSSESKEVLGDGKMDLFRPFLPQLSEDFSTLLIKVVEERIMHESIGELMTQSEEPKGILNTGWEEAAKNQASEIESFVGKRLMEKLSNVTQEEIDEFFNSIEPEFPDKKFTIDGNIIREE